MSALDGVKLAIIKACDLVYRTLYNDDDSPRPFDEAVILRTSADCAFEGTVAHEMLRDVVPQSPQWLVMPLLDLQIRVAEWFSVMPAYSRRDFKEREDEADSILRRAHLLEEYLDDTARRAPPPPPTPDFMPAKWFQVHYGIPGARLRKRAQRVEGFSTGEGSNVRYSVPMARAFWPDDMLDENGVDSGGA